LMKEKVPVSLSSHHPFFFFLDFFPTLSSILNVFQYLGQPSCSNSSQLPPSFPFNSNAFLSTVLLSTLLTWPNNWVRFYPDCQLLFGIVLIGGYLSSITFLL
jgi:hypothetical protein